MSWRGHTALLLLVPIYWWLVTVLPPPFGVVECVMHMAEAGEHCDDFCAHPTSPIDPPQATALFDTPDEELVYHEQLIALFRAVPSSAGAPTAPLLFPQPQPPGSADVECRVTHSSVHRSSAQDTKGESS